MSKYTKYKLYQKYETRGSQEAIPCYPNVFSIDGDGTMPLVIVEENSRDCGYTGDTQPIYRWYQMPIDTYYYCDACQDAQYKWVNLPISQDWECVGTTKYYKQKKQVSVDGGSTWTDVEPPQYQRGALYEQNSSSCGYRTRTTTGSPYCEQYDKYVDVYNQYSTDGGNTWQTTATTPPMVEHNSAYCGYVPLSTKLRASYINGTSYSADCDSNTTLTSGDTRPNGYIYTAMTSAEIGDCITSIGIQAFDCCTSLTSIDIPNSAIHIGYMAFRYCTSLTSCTIGSGVTSIGNYAFGVCSGLTSINIPSGVTTIGNGAFNYCTSLTSIVIPNSVTSIGNQSFYWCTGLTSCTIGSGVTSIGDYAFRSCSGLTSIDIPDGVTSIGDYAFRYCGSLTSITVNAITPPTLGTNVFYNTNDCPIYVPCESVQAYKTASRWSDYASRIRGIPPCDEPTPSEDQYLTFVARGSGTFVAYKYTSSSTAQYSKDNGSSWISLTSISTNISVSSGDRVMFKGLLEQSSSSSPFVCITGTTQYEIEGNIMSLVYGDNFIGKTTFPSGFNGSICTFGSDGSDSNNPYLTSIGGLVLPATALTTDCYINMFYHCTSITSVPSGFLPATTLANVCYGGMFWGCTSLTSVPSDLLPATTLPSKGCYAYMFADTKITRAPDLPAPILPPYSSSVINDYCYGGMFQDCSRLNYIKCLATSGMGDYTTWDWLSGVSSSGTFVKASNATWSRGASGIPTNWTIQNA